MQTQDDFMIKHPVQAPTAWPNADFSRVPYAVFTDADIYQLENERIFRGPVWNYLCHEVDLPEVGSFVTNWIGDIQVVVTRAEDQGFHAFENSCAHRGAQLVTAVRGRAQSLTCPYHLWSYSLKGELTGVPLLKGLKGKGGMPYFSDSLTPAQIADVTNYIRTHFGNAYKDTVTAADVAPFATPPTQARR